MKTKQEIDLRLSLGYFNVHGLFKDHGYIVWRVGTGENVEILFIEGPGHGKELVKEMVEILEQTPPYNSIFVFRREQNEIAGKFYRKLGFTETVIPDLYKGENAVLATINFEKLKQNLYAETSSK